MAKYVDVDINPADYVTVWDVDGEYGKQTVMAVDDLQYLPAIDAAPVVHGRWVNSPNQPECVVCSECLNDNLSRQFIALCDYPYCPFCGSRMDLPAATETIGYADESGLAPAT